MDFTQEQKMAMAKILWDIVSVDGKIDSRETLFFETVKNDLHLSTEDHYAILNLNTLRSLSSIKAMATEQKVLFAETMKDMILADKYIDPNEAISFYDICNFLQITGVGLSTE